ncbi:MAG: hypothetical protein H0W61_05010 [Bacteroidetes bacterium]|nr:hypothetical protein [Bacteroidota bacterium]
MRVNLKYKFSNAAIVFTVLLAVISSYYLNWSKHSTVNFADGDSKDYYSYLLSVFIHHDLGHQQGSDWFLMQTGSGTINVHPVGVSLLILPFFGIGSMMALLLHFPLDGLSLPFQVSMALAALFYACIGLIFIKKTLILYGTSDKITALVLLLTFFGTNLLNYTLNEALMSHVYSFSLISIFLYHSGKYITLHTNRNLYFSATVLGLIILVRPNNILVLLSVFIWFSNRQQCKEFFRNLFRSRVFYSALLITFLLVLIQSLVWYIQSGSLLHHTYKADGFYWLHPQILKMLFGFDGGFFVYVPLCFVFLFGLTIIYKESKFRFIAFTAFLALLIYFFASYWAYTYFDGLGIRVLVDFYAFFSFLGAKLFTQLSFHKGIFAAVSAICVFFTYISLVYCYQQKNNILLRSGMTFNQWKYIFLKTNKEYNGCLGGSNDLTPYAKAHPAPSLSKESPLERPYNFEGNDFSVGVGFDSIGFSSNRLHFKIDVDYREATVSTSKDALICVVVEDKDTTVQKKYAAFRMNETPATECCENHEYHYTLNMLGRFKNSSKIIVYIWNVAKKAFFVNKFSVRVYNYNYQIN